MVAVGVTVMRPGISSSCTHSISYYSSLSVIMSAGCGSGDRRASPLRARRSTQPNLCGQQQSRRISLISKKPHLISISRRMFSFSRCKYLPLKRSGCHIDVSEGNVMHGVCPNASLFYGNRASKTTPTIFPTHCGD